MRSLRIVIYCLIASLLAAAPARAQTGYDRPGGDYSSFAVRAGDPAACAARCEREGRCRAWSFSYPRTAATGAMCWLKNQVTPRVENSCCVSGVKGAGVLERKSGPIEFSIDRTGGDYQESWTWQPIRPASVCGHGVRGRAALPRLDLCAAGLSRAVRALLPEGAAHRAAPQAVLRVGRGAVIASHFSL